MGYFGSKATPGLCQALIAMMPPQRNRANDGVCFPIGQPGIVRG